LAIFTFITLRRTGTAPSFNSLGARVKKTEQASTGRELMKKENECDMQAEPNRTKMFEKRNFIHYTLFCFFCTSIISLSAQTFDLGSWNIVNLKYSHNEKLSFFGEAQIRSLKFYNNFHYYEYKGGINYKVHKNVKLTLGAGTYQTYKEGGDFVLPKNNDEFRLWPQTILFQSIGNLKIEQRYRAEFRFTSTGFRNRFRYRLGVSYSFGKERNEYKPFQVTASNEIFFTDKEPYFERNRMLLAFNYKPSKATTIQIGYLHQFDYKINDETGRDFFQIGFFMEFFRKATEKTASDTEIKDN
jgi:hypothetical protein